MIPFEQYAKVRKNCCICYFGHSDEYLVQLRLIKPLLEESLPDLNFFFCCKDDKIPLLKGCASVPLSQIKTKKQGFAYLSELAFNGRTHPIEDLLVEVGIKQVQCVGVNERTTNKCLIVSKGNYPTLSLSKEQIGWLQSLARQEGYEAEIDGDLLGSSLVMGVESVDLFEAVAQGMSTKLVPTGVGARLYKLLAPNGRILHR
jgi:hypothetical protein